MADFPAVFVLDADDVVADLVPPGCFAAPVDVVDPADFVAAGLGFVAEVLGVGFGATTALAESFVDESLPLFSASPETAPIRFSSSRRSASVSLCLLYTSPSPRDRG